MARKQIKAKAKTKSVAKKPTRKTVKVVARKPVKKSKVLKKAASNGLPKPSTKPYGQAGKALNSLEGDLDKVPG